MTKVGWYAMGNATPLEFTKSCSGKACYQGAQMTGHSVDLVGLFCLELCRFCSYLSAWINPSAFPTDKVPGACAEHCGG